MNIGFDAKKAIVNLTGIGNYSRRVVEALAREYPSDGLFLFGPRKKPVAPIIRTPDVHFVSPPAFGGKLTYELWRNRFLRGDMRKNSIDVYHGLSNEIPTGLDLCPTRTVVTIHDLIFLTRPETFKPAMRLKLRKKTLYACHHADRIIAVSRRTADDIIRLYDIDPMRIDIVYQSIDPVFFVPVSDPTKADVAARYLLPEKFVLCVGTIEQRKNQELIIKALPFVDKNIHAVIAGRPTPYQQLLAGLATDLGVADRVRFINGLPNTDLPALYQLASVFCLPSIYEGFGLPVAEALASCVPVIAATGSCLEEAGGPDSIYVDPFDEKALASSITKITDDAGLRDRMISKGADYVTRFSDTAMAKGLMETYRRALSGR